MVLEDAQVGVQNKRNAITRFRTLYGVAIKVLAYLIAFRLQTHREFSHLSITQLMRKIQREYRLQELMEEHFHLPNFLKPGRIGQRC